jgi:L-aminopeptidase/D-esterase-like protein
MRPLGGYTVGVLVQCNYGSRMNLRIASVPVGREIPSEDPYAFMPSNIAEHGSIIVVVATRSSRINSNASPAASHSAATAASPATAPATFLSPSPPPTPAPPPPIT